MFEESTNYYRILKKRILHGNMNMGNDYDNDIKKSSTKHILKETMILFFTTERNRNIRTVIKWYQGEHS